MVMRLASMAKRLVRPDLERRRDANAVRGALGTQAAPARYRTRTRPKQRRNADSLLLGSDVALVEGSGRPLDESQAVHNSADGAKN